MLTKKELHDLARETIKAFREHGQDGAGTDELDLAKGYLALEAQFKSFRRKVARGQTSLSAYSKRDHCAQED